MAQASLLSLAIINVTEIILFYFIFTYEKNVLECSAYVQFDGYNFNVSPCRHVCSC
jgi:hypothetical protein